MVAALGWAVVVALAWASMMAGGVKDSGRCLSNKWKQEVYIVPVKVGLSITSVCTRTGYNSVFRAHVRMDLPPCRFNDHDTNSGLIAEIHGLVGDVQGKVQSNDSGLARG